MKHVMAKRIWAWILLIGFIILIINLSFIRYQWKLSLIIYIAAAAYFLIRINGRK